MIKLYRIDGCHWCDKTEEYLRSTNKELVVIDVEKDPEGKKEMLSKTNENSVPVVDIDGTIFVGYNRRLMSEAIYGYVW